MKQKLTPWFDGSIKPVRVGVYERKIPDTHCTAFWRWSGAYWEFGATALPETKPDFTLASRSTVQNLKWRGLAVKP